MAEKTPKEKIIEGFINAFSRADYQESKTMRASILSDKRGWKTGLKRTAYHVGFPKSFIPNVILNNKVLYFIYMGGRCGQEYLTEDGERFIFNTPHGNDLDYPDDEHNLNLLGKAEHCQLVEDIVFAQSTMSWSIAKVAGDTIIPSLQKEIKYHTEKVKQYREILEQKVEKLLVLNQKE